MQLLVQHSWIITKSQPWALEGDYVTSFLFQSVKSFFFVSKQYLSTWMAGVVSVVTDMGMELPQAL